MPKPWKTPSPARYIQALRSIRPLMTESELDMLEAHFLAPAHAMVSIDLAHAARYRDFRPANSVYSSLGLKLRRALRLPVDDGLILAASLVDVPEKKAWANGYSD